MPTPYDDLLRELTERPQELLVIVGAGVSIAATKGAACASWKGLLFAGLDMCRDQCGLPPEHCDRYRAMLADPSASGIDYINAASFVDDTLKRYSSGLFARWLGETVGRLRVIQPDVISALNEWRVRLATTNYDGLLEEVTGRSPLTWRQGPFATDFLRQVSLEHVLHLHGHWQTPESVILGARSYEDVCRDPMTQSLLQAALKLRTVVFVGCGGTLDDPNFGSLMKWARQAVGDDMHRHFLLVRGGEVPPHLPGFITPVPFGASHGDLPQFLRRLSEQAVAARRTESPWARLASAQASIDTQFDRLHTEQQQGGLTGDQYVRQVGALCSQLWQQGGHRRAVNELTAAVMHHAAALADQDAAESALVAMEWGLEVGWARESLPLLDVLKGRLQRLPAVDPLHDRANRLRLRYADALCDYRQTLDLLRQLMAAASPPERARLQAEEAEVHLLQGEFASALAAAEEGQP